MLSRLSVLLCVVFSGHLFAQSTFSFRSTLGTPFLELTSVEVLDNGHIRAYGYASPPEGGYKTGVAVVELNEAGELIGSPRFLFRSGTEINAFAQGKRQGNYYYQGGHIVDSLFKSAVFRIDSDTIEVYIETESEDERRGIFQLIGLDVDSTGIYFSGHEQIPLSENSSLFRGFLEHFNLAGEKEWSVNFGNETNWVYLIWSVRKTGGQIIVGGQRSNSMFRQVNKRINAKVWAFDTAGQLLWEWESPQNLRYLGAQDVIATPDGGLLIATAEGREMVNGAGYGFLVFQPCVLKLNTERQIEWQTLFRNNPYYSSDHELNRIIAVSDGSGYVVTGKSSAYFPENDPETENPGDLGGIIAKVSPEGDSLWSRILIHPNMPSFLENGNLYDIKETPDGGFVMVGYSYYVGGEDAGWIIKVDEYGCLVPGCHLVSSTQEASEEGITLLLSPNPTADLLHVYVGPGVLAKDAELMVYDLNGSILQRRAANRADATYLLEVGQFPAGQYYVQLQDTSGERSKAQAFIVK